MKLIKQKDVIDVIWKCYPYGIEHSLFDEIEEKIKALPSAEAVEVVRCKDCKYSHLTYRGECKYCDLWEGDGEALYLEGDFYCAWAEKQTESREDGEA